MLPAPHQYLSGLCLFREALFRETLFRARFAYNGIMKDYYKILQIDPEASLEVMNNAYRALVRQYHPDLYHSQRKTAMNEKMQEINEAYQVLSNAATRAEYDRKRRDVQPGTGELPKTASIQQSLRWLLLWGVGTFIVVKFLLGPILSNPVLKVFLAFAVIFGLIRFYSKRKPTP